MSDTAMIPTQPTILGLVDKAIENPDFNADALEKLLDMQERVLDRDAKQSFNAAFVRCQATMPSIIKDSYNTQTESNYAKLETINKHLIPHYTSHGFAITFGTADSPLDNHVRVTAEVIHQEGHTKEYLYDSPHDGAGIKGTKNKTDAHARASALTYGERYLVTMIFNIVVTDDDDGNSANTQLYTEDQWDLFKEYINEDDPNPLGYAAIDNSWQEAMGAMRSRHLEPFKAVKGVTKESNRLRLLVKDGHAVADEYALQMEQCVDSQDFDGIEEISNELTDEQTRIVWAHVKDGYRTEIEKQRRAA